MKIKHIIASVTVPLVATFLFAQTALAATPTLSLVASTGDSVQLTVQGDANSNVMLFYNVGSSSGVQSRPLGTTDSSGHFTLLISTGGFGITPNLSAYTIVNGQQSNSVTWPAAGTGSTGTINLSQNNITLSPGQVTVISLSGGSNSFFISNNSNSSAVTLSLSGTQLTATGGSAGSATITLCDQTTLTNCASLNITTSGTSTSGNTGSIVFNPNNVSVNSGNGATIVLLSGGSNYAITTNTNSAALNASINGSSVNLSANTTGSATAAVTVCSGGTSSCGILNVSINGGIIPASSTSAPTFSQSSVTMSPGSTQSVTITGSGGYTISNNSNPSIVTPSINGNILTLSAPAGTSGSATITVCQQSGGCGVVTVSTNGTGTTGSNVFFSPSSPTASIGQTVPVTVSGGNGTYFLSSNPSPNIAGSSLNANILTLTGVGSGTDSITVCASSGGCGSLSVTVGGNSTQTSGAVSFSQTNPTLTVGQTLNITLSGGAGSYFLSSSATTTVQASINGSTLTLSGVNAGSVALSVCSASGGCSTLSVAVNPAAQTTTVTTQPPTTTATTQTTTATTPMNAAALKSILSQIQQLTTFLLQLENQAIAQLQQLGNGAVASSAVTTDSSRTFTQNLSLGSTGSEVTALQQRLTSEGVYSGPINGAFGAATEKALKAYQTSHGISPLGIVGPATRNSLNGS